MLRTILFTSLMSVAGVSLAQERFAPIAGAVTSISPQGHEIIVGQEIYFLPAQLKMDGLLVTRSRVASLLQQGDEIMLELEKSRTIKAIHSRLR